MKRIELYKTDGKTENQINKTIREIADELEKRLESQGLKPDLSFLSMDFKKIQKEAFPVNSNVSGMLSVNNDMVVATVSVLDKDNPEVKGKMLNTQYKIEEGKAAEAFEKATAALKLMVQSFWMNVDEKKQLQAAEAEQPKQQDNSITKQQDQGKKIEPQVLESGNAEEVAKSIQRALANPDVAAKYIELQKNQGKTEDKAQVKPEKTVTLSTGAKALGDEKIINNGNSLKNQLINVNFTPEQAEVVIELLEENQKKYEPKSSMFGLLGDVLGKMLHALSRKLDEIIDVEKLTTEKLNSIYSAINNENCEDFIEKYRTFNLKIKYCHDFICEAAQGQSIQSTNIINQILNREKVPVSIRTLQNAFVTALDNNLESALTIYKYADANLHGEAHFDTMRGFLSHSLNVLSDNNAEKFIKASSFKTLDDTVIFKEMIRAEKYGLLNSSLQHCESIDEHAPSLFYFAAKRKDVEAMHTLVSKGANVNANNSEALYACFETNSLDAAKVLLNYGADVSYLRNRIEQIRRSNPNNVADGNLTSLTESNFNFLKDIYKHCGLNEHGTMDIHETAEQIEQTQQAELAVDNEFDGHDVSLE